MTDDRYASLERAYAALEARCLAAENRAIDLEAARAAGRHPATTQGEAMTTKGYDAEELEQVRREWADYYEHSSCRRILATIDERDAAHAALCIEMADMERRAMRAENTISALKQDAGDIIGGCVTGYLDAYADILADGIPTKVTTNQSDKT